LKQTFSSVNDPYLVIGCMIVHLFDGCGLVSFGSTRPNKFLKNYDTRADNNPFVGRGICKAMVLLASEICAAGTGSRALFVQAIKDTPSAYLFKSMGFQKRGGTISNTRVEEMKGKIQEREDSLGVQFICTDRDNVLDLVIDRKPRFTFNLGQGQITGLREYQIVDEDNNEAHDGLEGNLYTPPLPRKSPRLIKQRKTRLTLASGSLRFTHRCTEFYGLRYSQTQNRWFGLRGKNIYEEVEVSYVMRNFSSALIDECYHTPERVIEIPASAPKLSQPPVPVDYMTLIPVYQQLGNDTCMFSAASSAFKYFGDTMAHNILRSNIMSSTSVANRLGLMTSLLFSSQCNYIAKKYKRGTFNVFENICCFPTVLVLEGSDGAINHSVTVAGCWLFDSNTMYAQRISMPLLDWCCSTDSVKVDFARVYTATRFKQRKPRKEWKLCDNCRNGCKQPCLTKYMMEE